MLGLHRQAAEAFAALVDSIGDGDWGRPTPCAQWDVRALVAHVVWFSQRVPELLTGGQTGTMPSAEDVLGDDPAATTRRAAAEAGRSFERPGALDSMVHHPTGDLPASLFLVLRIFDYVVHGWDLSQPLGRPFAVDSDLVEFVRDRARELEAGMAATGLFEPPIALDSGGDALAELLARCGRAVRPASPPGAEMLAAREGHDGVDARDRDAHDHA